MSDLTVISGVVDSVEVDTATVTFDDDGQPVPGIGYLDRPKAGDVVKVLALGPSRLIMGTVGKQTGGVPVGALAAWGKSTAPAGWLICDGSAFDDEAYPLLAEFLGGTTLPDYRGRYLVGADSNHALGGIGGSRFLPQHTHPGTSHTHTGPSHTHSVSITTSQGTTGFSELDASSGSINLLEDHTHSVTGNTGAAGTGNTGAATAATANNTANTVNDEPPWAAVHVIIHAG